MGISSSRSATTVSQEQDTSRLSRRRKCRQEAVDEIASDEDEPSLSPKRYDYYYMERGDSIILDVVFRTHLCTYMRHSISKEQDQM